MTDKRRDQPTFTITHALCFCVSWSAFECLYINLHHLHSFCHRQSLSNGPNHMAQSTKINIWRSIRTRVWEPYKASRLHVEPLVQNRNSRLHPSAVMQRSAILGLLLACAASLGICGVILEDGAPILWAQTASQLTDLPNQNGVVTPNPWNYLHRLSMLRLLIAATDPYMSSMGTNATDSPVWGLPLQLAWMLTSGESWGERNYPTETSVQWFVNAPMVWILWR